jgi:hypothetical protein
MNYKYLITKLIVLVYKKKHNKQIPTDNYLAIKK